MPTLFVDVKEFNVENAAPIWGNVTVFKVAPVPVTVLAWCSNLPPTIHPQSLSGIAVTPRNSISILLVSIVDWFACALVTNPVPKRGDESEFVKKPEDSSFSGAGAFVP